MAPGAVGSCGGHEDPEHVEKLHGPQGVEAARATGACACLYLGMKAAGPIAVKEDIRVPGSGMRSPKCFGKKNFIESDDIAARPKDIFVANRRFQVSTAQPSHSPSSPVEISMCLSRRFLFSLFTPVVANHPVGFLGISAVWKTRCMPWNAILSPGRSATAIFKLGRSP